MATHTSAGVQPTATHANVAGSASSVQLFASNPEATARSIYNDSSAALYVKFGTTASSSSFVVKLNAGDLFEFPLPLYDGVVHGIWTSATGNARTLELS